MKKEIINCLSQKLDSVLEVQGFSVLNTGLHFVRNINEVFHNIEVILDEGTSTTEDGFRIKLFADIWSPHLAESIKEIKTFPNEYEPLIGGQVSKVRVNGNGFVDIDSTADIFIKVEELVFWINSKVLPWFELFHDIKSTKRVMSSLSIDFQEKNVSDKSLSSIREKYTALSADDLDAYAPSDRILDSIYLADNILPIFHKKLSAIDFKQVSSNGQEIFLSNIYNEIQCSVSFELMDAAFMRVWLHIIQPEMLPDGYWEQLSMQYVVPPLIGRPIDATSVCVLRADENDIQRLIELTLLPQIESLKTREGMINFIKGVIPNGLLGKSLDDVLNVI